MRLLLLATCDFCCHQVVLQDDMQFGTALQTYYLTLHNTRHTWHMTSTDIVMFTSFTITPATKDSLFWSWFPSTRTQIPPSFRWYLVPFRAWHPGIGAQARQGWVRDGPRRVRCSKMSQQFLERLVYWWNNAYILKRWASRNDTCFPRWDRWVGPQKTQPTHIPLMMGFWTSWFSARFCHWGHPPWSARPSGRTQVPWPGPWDPPWSEADTGNDASIIPYIIHGTGIFTYMNGWFLW